MGFGSGGRSGLGAQAASRSSAPISTAAKASRLRAPRNFSSDRAVADHPADRRQRLQMLGAGVGRRQQQEDEVDRLAVDRLVVDRLGQPHDQA